MVIIFTFMLPLSTFGCICYTNGKGFFLSQGHSNQQNRTQWQCPLAENITLLFLLLILEIIIVKKLTQDFLTNII